MVMDDPHRMADTAGVCIAAAPANHPPGSRPFVRPALRVRRESVAVTARGGGTSYPIASTERTAAPISGIVMRRISITVTNPLIEATTR